MKNVGSVVALGVCSSLSFALGTQGAGVPIGDKKTVQARVFQIVDENGKVRAELGINDSGSVGMSLHRNNGDLSLWCGVGGSGRSEEAKIYMMSGSGAITLSTINGRAAYVKVEDSDGLYSTMSASKDRSRVSVCDGPNPGDATAGSVSLECGQKGEPRIRFVGRDGKERYLDE